MDKKNRHGLKRYIPTSVRKKVRQNSGYGCVICGNAIVDYEHVDPEFKDAKAHNAACITLLCPGCHSKVTRGSYSKEKVKEAMKHPWAFENGLSYDDLDMPAKEPEIIVGDSKYSGLVTLLDVKGKKLVSFKKPENKFSPYLINAEFYNQKGDLTAKIRDNIFQNVLGDHDIQFVGGKIIIKCPGYKNPSLELERLGGQDLKVIQLDMFYNGVAVTVNKEGEMRIKIGNSEYSLKNSVASNCNTIFAVS